MLVMPTEVEAFVLNRSLHFVMLCITPVGMTGGVDPANSITIEQARADMAHSRSDGDPAL
jgi:hypothetical protein